MAITILKETDLCPFYEVSFSTNKNSKEPKSFQLDRIRVCAQRSFELTSMFFIALKSSTYSVLRNSHRSFFYVILDRWPERVVPEIAIPVFIFRFIFWFATLGWGISTNTLRLFRENFLLSQKIFLKEFASDEINVEHIKTNEIALDASSVPEDIKVDDLISIFDKINFTDKHAPGYMAPTTRKEGNCTFTKEQLREHLENFTRRVNTKEAFLGTPPSYDISRLIDFYQQIEDAVRLSIYKVTCDVNDFEQQNGTNYILFDGEKKKKYKDLLETRARVALDLAIAGAHCGARYMGEAMDVYYNLYGEGIQNNKDLHGTLLEILAEKRKEIAKRDIQKYLGANAHAFTNYMSNVGKLIGIPGSENIIEHLSRNFNTYDLLDKFFQSYTVDVIIETIQEKVKTSPDLLRKITDWVKDQVGDWNKGHYEEISDDIIHQIQSIRDSSLNEPFLANNFSIFLEILTDLKEKKFPLPQMYSGWNNFIEEVFSLQEVKDKLYAIYIKEKLQKGCNWKSFLEWRNAFKIDCFSETLGPKLCRELQKKVVSDHFIPIEPKQYMPIFIEKAKIARMRQVLSKHNIYIEQDTLSRILRNEADLAETIKYALDLARRESFLSHVAKDHNLYTMGEEGISKELIEWILVSHKILYPQVVHKLEVSDLYIDPVLFKQYVNVIHQEFHNNPKVPKKAKKSLSLEALYGLLRGRYEELLQNLSRYASVTSKKRYNHSSQSKKEKVLTWIFKQSFQHNPDNVIAAAEVVNGGKSVYPNWKKVCLIKFPAAFSSLFSHEYFQVALVIFAIFNSTFLIFKVHEKIMRSFLTLRQLDACMGVYQKIAIKIFAGLCIKEPIEEGVLPLSQQISLYFFDIAQRSRKEQYISYKKTCLQLWKNYQVISLI